MKDPRWALFHWKYFTVYHRDRLHSTRNLTLLYLWTPKPADTTRRKEVRRNSSAGVANPPDKVTSTRFPLNNATVTTVLAYPSKSDAPTITTWKFTKLTLTTDIDAFERYCKDSRIFQHPNDEAWRALRNVFPLCTMDELYGIISMKRSERQLPWVSL